MPDDSLLRQLETFAETTNNAVSTLAGPGNHVTVRKAPRSLALSTPEKGVVFCADRKPVMRLSLSFVSRWSANQKYMAIQRSTIQVLPVRPEDLTEADTDFSPPSNEPLVRFDYDRGSNNVPASHINIHSHHPQLGWIMSRGHPKSRSAKKAPRTDVLHFPTGGHRFRPSLEDILEALVVDFGIDITDEGRALLRRQRVEFRKRQLAAAIGDETEAAAEALRDLGYNVTLEPGCVTPSPRLDRLEAL